MKESRLMLHSVTRESDQKLGQNLKCINEQTHTKHANNYLETLGHGRSFASHLDVNESKVAQKRVVVLFELLDQSAKLANTQKIQAKHGKKQNKTNQTTVVDIFCAYRQRNGMIVLHALVDVAQNRKHFASRFYQQRSNKKPIEPIEN